MIKRIVSAMAVMIFLACFTLLCIAGTHSPWDGTGWDVTSPDIDQPHGNAYKEIYDLRKGVAIRMNKEHETLATSSAGGVHKQGSARAFFQDAAPTTQVDGSAFDSGDLGSLWFDTNASPDNQFNVLTATTPTWTPVSTEIIAVLLASNRQFAGTLTIDSTLTVTGESTFNNHINLGAGDDLIGSSTSDITINTNKFTVAGATGNTVVAGTLDVTGVLTTTAASVLGDGSTLAAATQSGDGARTITDKAYVDAASQFGSWASASKASSTLAATDGFLLATNTAGTADVTIKTDSSNPPTTVRARSSTGNTNIGMTVPCPVKRGEYWLIECTQAITGYWIPLGD